MLHGSTAPGFLFASGFVVGLPRAPLSLRAGLRRARRLLFVLAVGYCLHLPYFSLWKTLGASTSAERAALFACDALQVIAATQLFVLGLQALARRRWTAWAGGIALAIVAVTPLVWATGVAARWPEAAGTLARRSHRLALSGVPVLGLRAGRRARGRTARPCQRRVAPPARAGRRDRSWCCSALCWPGCSAAGSISGVRRRPTCFVRLGGLLLLLRLVEAAAATGHAVVRALALLGHETLLVYVLHLTLLFGGVFGPAPLVAWQGSLGFARREPRAAWRWSRCCSAPPGSGARAKQRAPHEAQLLLVFLTIAFLYEFAVRPW